MDDDSPPQPTVERVEKPDGRYVLYFTWPDEPPDGDAQDGPPSAADE